jgi:hypothetical protein
MGDTSLRHPSSHGLVCRLGAAGEGASVRIWVIGSDPLARALGRNWARAGHEVPFTFSFDGTDFDALAAETGGRYATLAERAAAEVVLLAAPWAAGGRGAGSRAGGSPLSAGTRAGRLPVAHPGWAVGRRWVRAAGGRKSAAGEGCWWWCAALRGTRNRPLLKGGLSRSSVAGGAGLPADGAHRRWPGRLRRVAAQAVASVAQCRPVWKKMCPRSDQSSSSAAHPGHGPDRLRRGRPG